MENTQDSKKSQKPVLVVAAVISKTGRSQGEILVVRRGPDQSGAGYWEFPGGKVESGEEPETALIREIKEELNLDISLSQFICENEHAYPEKTIFLKTYLAQALNFEDLMLTEHDMIRWDLPRNIEPEILSEADRPVLKCLKIIWS